MYSLFAKLLCAAAFASAGVAQSLSIKSPQPGASFKGGDRIIVELEETAIPEALDEIALVIRATSGPFDGSNLGNSNTAYQGIFSAQRTDGKGNKYANYSIPAPDWFIGPGSVNVAHLFLSGAYGTLQLEYATVNISVYGNSG